MRVKKGGHGIEDSLIEKRFIKSKENIVSIAKNSLIDIYFYDNSGSNILLSASYSKGNWIEYSNVKWVDELKNQILVC